MNRSRHWDEPLRTRLAELARSKPRFGYRRLQVLLRRFGEVVRRVSYSSRDKARKKQARMPVVFVISPDWTLRTMVRAELREAGIMALGMQATGDLEEVLVRGVVPSTIVLDGDELKDPKAQEILETLAQDVAVLVIDSVITPAPPLPGTEVLHRPVDVRDIASRVLARLGRRKI